MRISALAPRSFSEVGRFFLIFLIFSSLFLITSPAFAKTTTPQVTPAATAYPPPSTASDVPNTLHNWTQNVMIEVMAAMTCQIAGVDPVNPKQQCLGIDQKNGKIGFISPSTSSGGGGAIGVMGKMISVLYTPPAHTTDYFQNLAANFGLAKKAYAQGTGFDSLKPLMAIWSAFRNIVYLIFVIVFVVIGLAIMLRVKIDPRTVMSVQNQIPKIIIGILLVTFSFAIAGFLIDLMWVFIYLFWGVISGIQVIDPSTGKNIIDVANLNPATIQGQNAIRVAGHIATGGIFGITNSVATSVREILKDLLGIRNCSSMVSCTITTFNPLHIFSGFSGINFTDSLFDIISLFSAGAAYWKAASLTKLSLLGFDLSSLLGIPVGLTAGISAYEGTQLLLREFLPWLIAYLIIFIALLFALFRLWFTLLMAYVYILLDVVLAPFWIIAGAVPGSPISFTGWLRDIGSNLLAFPATIAMFLLGKVFMDAFGQPPTKDYFVPPLIGNASAPNVIGPLIGLGFILVTPNIVNLLKQMLKAPKIDISSIGQAIGAGVGVPISTVKGIGATMLARNEYIPGGPGGQFKQRGIASSLFGRLVGRG